MIKISTVTEKIINENALFQFGISYDLMNLSQLARYLKPLIEARIKKESSVSAIMMTLSRMQRRMKKIRPNRESYYIKKLTIHSNLSDITYIKSKNTHEKINDLYQIIQSKRGYITITEGVNEITVICDEKYTHLIKESIKEKPKDEELNVASVGIEFDEDFINAPGLLYSVLQQIALQNINLVEISSTYSEFILYIDEKDMKLAFNTLFHCFNVHESVQMM